MSEFTTPKQGEKVQINVCPQTAVCQGTSQQNVDSLIQMVEIWIILF